MKEEIKKDGNDIVFTLRIPLKAHRTNPYNEEENSEMDNIVGVVNDKMSEYTFNYWIDMAYKGKEDQISIPFYIFQGDKEEFIKVCKELGVAIVTES